MKITDVKTYCCFEPFEKVFYSGLGKLSGRDVLIIQIDTDTDITGYSYLTGLEKLNGAEIKTLDLIIREGFRQSLVGEDPLRHEYLWHKCYRGAVRFGRKGAVVRALSGIDIALWDIKGKKAGMPLHQLLGGFTDRVPVYMSGGHYAADGDSVAYIREEMQKYADQGFKAVKIRVGRASLSEDTKRIETARRILGDDALLMVDAGENMDYMSAYQASLAWAPYRLYWFEEPIPTDQVDMLRQLRAKSQTPIALGENEYTRYGFRDMIDGQAVDVIQPDVTRVGGITEWIKIANYASAKGIKVAPHGIQEVHAALAAGVDNFLILEYTPTTYHMQTFIDRLFVKPVETKILQADGTLAMPTGNGIGLEIDWDLVNKTVQKLN